MNRYNQLLTRIANEYSIKKGTEEDTLHWKTRIVYSLLGQMALASLFDTAEEEEISLVHMKKRIKDVLYSYIDMYSELSSQFSTDLDELSDEIYDIYLHTGVIYHTPNRVRLAAKSSASAGKIKLIRGYAIDQKQKLSGLGSFLIDVNRESEFSIDEMFLLEAESLIERWQRCTNVNEWDKLGSDSHVEYLRTKPPFKRGYWVDKPDLDGKISLLRVVSYGQKMYYMYKAGKEGIFVSQLPEWMVEDYNYRSLSNSCLAYRGVLPETIYRYAGDIVYVSFGYLPPPSELYLWKLYSWPSRYSYFPCDFNRICAKEIFEVLRSTMSKQGYVFKEEK